MIEEDYEAWDAYPQYRWLFNKLELSFRLGYSCGPACVPIKKTGYYIVRPTYNLYGMGIGAHKKFLDVDLHGEEMTHHKHIPPGHFWCEWLDGTHYSVDFVSNNGKWKPFCCMKGTHFSTDNLTKFKEWEVTDFPFSVDVLPEWIHDIKTEKYLNIEIKDTNILEIHLRSGNDMAWDYNVGTKIIPVWKGEDYKDHKQLSFIPNFHPESFKYEADGNLSDIRVGYYVDEKI